MRGLRSQAWPDMVIRAEIKEWVEYAQATGVEEVSAGRHTDIKFLCDIYYTETYGVSWLISSAKLGDDPARWKARVCREHGTELSILW